MPLQFSKVIEGMGAVQFARVDQAHVQVTNFDTIQRCVEQRVLSIMKRFP